MANRSISPTIIALRVKKLVKVELGIIRNLVAGKIIAGGNGFSVRITSRIRTMKRARSRMPTIIAIILVLVGLTHRQ